MTTQISNGMNEELRNRIMRKVYIIWFFRKIAPILFLEMPFLFFIALHEAARQFFIAKILQNFVNAALGSSQPFWSTASFIRSALASALAKSDVAPLAIIGISGIFMAALLMNLIKNLRLGFQKSSV